MVNDFAVKKIAYSCESIKEVNHGIDLEITLKPTKKLTNLVLKFIVKIFCVNSNLPAYD